MQNQRRLIGWARSRSEPASRSKETPRRERAASAEPRGPSEKRRSVRLDKSPSRRARGTPFILRLGRSLSCSIRLLILLPMEWKSMGRDAPAGPVLVISLICLWGPRSGAHLGPCQRPRVPASAVMDRPPPRTQRFRSVINRYRRATGGGLLGPHLRSPCPLRRRD